MRTQLFYQSMKDKNIDKDSLTYEVRTLLHTRDTFRLDRRISSVKQETALPVTTLHRKNSQLIMITTLKPVSYTHLLGLY